MSANIPAWAGVKPYIGAGVGLVYSKARLTVPSDPSATFEGDNSTHFAWQILAGVELGKKAFGEVTYLNGSQYGNTGIAFNIGARF